MLRSWLRTRARLRGRKYTIRSTTAWKFEPRLEGLDDRIAPAVAAFVSSPGVLSVVGDAAANTIVISRSPSGTILVNGATVPYAGGVLSASQVSLISATGGGGNDTIILSPANGGVPKGILKGGAGNDTLVGGLGQDQLFGEAGNDSLQGRDNKDVLNGGQGDDTLNGGKGQDQVNGNAGNDTMVWNNGDGSDRFEGGTESDTVRANGTSAADVFNISSNGSRAILLIGAIPVTLDIGTSEIVELNALGDADTATISDLTGSGVATVNLNLGVNSAGDAAADQIVVNGTEVNDVVLAAPDGSSVQVTGLAAQINITQSEAASDRLVINGLGGDDSISAGALASIIQLTLDGGSNNDTLNGGNGVDTLLGGSGDDVIDGNQGNDTAQMGDGNDTFVWDPGDGSDIVEGQAGQDTLRFNGSAGAEVFAASANGSRLRFTRNLGNIVMDTDDVEILALNALGGADSATINDLTGTDVTAVNIDLGVAGAGDGAADTVTVNGTAAADVVQAVSSGPAVQVNGLAAQVNIAFSEAANDRVVLNGLGGNDTLSGGALAALMQLTLDGGDGNDTLNGGNGADTLIGGDGNDTIDGNQGNDTALMGDGNDTFVWDPGDGSDVVEGQDGQDTLRFNGSAGAEIFAASANGGRLLFTRNVGNIVMDCDDVEVLALNALGGTDSVTINDLAATDISNVNIDLGVAGVGDGAVDTVNVNGTTGVDVMSLSGSAGSVTVQTAALVIAIVNAEPANDDLTINSSAGADIVSAAGLANSSVQLTINGGTDADILVGSQGNDTINGEAGNDTINGEAGNDTIDGGAGTDTIDGGTGTDTAVNGEIVTNVP